MKGVTGMNVLVAFLVLAVGRCVSIINKCPPGLEADAIKRVFGSLNNAQEGLWHRVPCLAYRPGEEIDRVIWWKGSSLEDTPTVRLISRFMADDHPTSDRFAFSSNFSLVIKGVEMGDEGRYLCEVEPHQNPKRVEQIDIRVIGNMFPYTVADEFNSTKFLLKRHRQILPCHCASPVPGATSVVYWSTGVGVTIDTYIIAARFSDGTVLQIQHGADYSIGRDASLTVNSLKDVQDTQRFWCHVFHQNGTLSNCYAHIHIAEDQQSAHGALKASERLFYLWKDTLQVLPCTSWTPGDTTCQIKWIKLGTSDPHIVLNYDLSTDAINADSPYDLGSDFSLVIQSVDDGHSGWYCCVVGNETRDMDLEVRVIGDQIPLDGHNATAREKVAFGPEVLTLNCLARLAITWTANVTLIWSYGAPRAQTTTVIGTLNLPDGSKTMSDLRVNGCFGISSDGSLILTNCSQDGDVRYWCHAFGGLLKASYVDLVLKNKVEDDKGALKASETSFYILKDTQQVLPCTSWAPGDRVDEIKWIKFNNSKRHIVLNYNLSTGAIIADSSYNLGSDYSLVIRSVDDDHAGRYRCVVANETREKDLDVRVIGDQLQLDGSNATAFDKVTFEPERLTFHCLARLAITWTAKVTLIWSYGSPDALAPNVVGTLNLPDGSKTMSDQGDKGCFGISTEGSLLMNNCSQVTNLRFWCHVFPFDGLVKVSYVDVLLKTKESSAHSMVAITVVSAVIVFSFAYGVLKYCLDLFKEERSVGDGVSTQTGST